jgi:hypothetical protein
MWRGVHHRLITFSAEAIQEVLPHGFVADIDERLYVVEPERRIYPDVVVLKRRPEEPHGVAPGGTAVLEEQEDPPEELSAYPVEIREPFIEIRVGEQWERVVTVIEFLSPANKSTGDRGRQEYLQKQAEVLNSETHLLEIDLLRTGAHTVAAPLQSLRERGHWDYLVCLHESWRRYTYLYWMISLRQRLPRIRVPLTGEVSPVILDLQSVFERAYDAGPYVQRVEYRAALPTPLTEGDATWMDALLREKGLRS